MLISSKEHFHSGLQKLEQRRRKNKQGEAITLLVLYCVALAFGAYRILRTPPAPLHEEGKQLCSSKTVFFSLSLAAEVDHRGGERSHSLGLFHKSWRWLAKVLEFEEAFKVQSNRLFAARVTSVWRGVIYVHTVLIDFCLLKKTLQNTFYLLTFFPLNHKYLDLLKLDRKGFLLTLSHHKSWRSLTRGWPNCNDCKL